jgi:hypothetical protein
MKSTSNRFGPMRVRSCRRQVETAINAAITLQLGAAANNTDTMNSREGKLNDLQKWRRGWDSNPRYGSPYARFRGEYFQPLSHLSAAVFSIVADDSFFFSSQHRRSVPGVDYRRAAKND